jgi:hypothetical protein
MLLFVVIFLLICQFPRRICRIARAMRDSWTLMRCTAKKAGVAVRR